MAVSGTVETERALGIGLIVASAAVYGLAGVLTKAIHADPLTITTWRGLVGGLLIAAYVAWQRRRARVRQPLRLGWRGWLMATTGAIASIAFIAAFKNTYVANVAVIYATAPFIAALLGWLIAGERAKSKTLAAAMLSLGGVGMIVFSGLGSGRPFGDALALVMTFGSALYMVMIRKFRDTPVVWAGAVSGLILFVLGWFVTQPLVVSGRDAWLLAAFGASFALASVLWTEGARRIPAAEAGLLGSAEVPFATLFGWLFLAELPPAIGLAGGAVVLAAVFAHAGHDWGMARRQKTIRRAESLKLFWRCRGTILRFMHFLLDGSSPSPPKPLDPSPSQADRKVGFFFGALTLDALRLGFLAYARHELRRNDVGSGTA